MNATLLLLVFASAMAEPQAMMTVTACVDNTASGVDSPEFIECLSRLPTQVLLSELDQYKHQAVGYRIQRLVEEKVEGWTIETAAVPRVLEYVESRHPRQRQDGY